MNSSLKRWRMTAILVTVLLTIFVAHSVLTAASAASASPRPHPAQGPMGPAGPQTVSTLTCGAVKGVKVVRQDVDITTSSTTLSAVPGMTTSVTVPSGTSGCLLMRFSAETQCTTSSGTFGWCVVIILVDGVEAFPGAGTDFAFDSTYNGTAVTDAWQSNSMDRSIRVGAGTHTIVVEWATTDPSITAWLGEMSLTVERTS
jgi:hypothetical protein